MKILKKIVIGIGILALLLCGLIVLCAINPDIEKKLACLVPQKEETVEPALSDPGIAIEEEITARQAKEGVSENGIPEETAEKKPGASGETYEIIGPQDSTKNTSQNNNKGANGYEIPSELKGKHLYRQIYANAVNAAFQPTESVEVSAIKDIIEAVYNDHPELFWLNTAFTASMTATISVRRLIWNSMILPRIYPRPWKHSAMKPVRFCGR